jgi:large subunit ribosomal protein L15
VREQLKKLPKLRGRGVNSLKGFGIRPTAVNISQLEALFVAGDTVTPVLLAERGLVRARKGTTPVVKILGDGELTKKLIISGCKVSTSAREKIEKAGGSVA